MLGLVRLVHPAPALAVTLLAGVLALLLGGESGTVDAGRVALVVAAVAGSQVATGALNDWADRDRDAAAGRPKPIPQRLGRSRRRDGARGGRRRAPAGRLAPRRHVVHAARARRTGQRGRVRPVAVTHAGQRGAVRRELRHAAAVDRDRPRRAALPRRRRSAAGRPLRGGGAPGQHAARLRQRPRDGLARARSAPGSRRRRDGSRWRSAWRWGWASGSRSRSGDASRRRWR